MRTLGTMLFRLGCDHERTDRIRHGLLGRWLALDVAFCPSCWSFQPVLARERA